MPDRRSILTIAACAALAACATTAPQPRNPAPSWPVAVREFASPEQMIEVAAQFPNSSGMQRRRLGVAFEAGDSAAVLDALRRLAAMGAVLSDTALQQMKTMVGEEMLAPIAADFAANAAPIAASRVHAAIPAEHRLVEGLVWDPEQRQLYATTVVDRSLLAVSEDRTTVAASEVSGSLFGGAYDPIGDRLWISSAYAPARIVRLHMAPDGLRVERLEVLERAHPEWEEVTLGTIVDDSFVYIADAQWARFGEDGAVQGEGPLQPTHIRAIPLSPSARRD